MVRMAVINGPGISARAQSLRGRQLPQQYLAGYARPALSVVNLLARVNECKQKIVLFIKSTLELRYIDELTEPNWIC